MNIAYQIVSDSKGKPMAVQVSIKDWQAILEKIEKEEQRAKMEADLKAAFAEVAAMKKSTKKKETLSDFLREL